MEILIIGNHPQTLKAPTKILPWNRVVQEMPAAIDYDFIIVIPETGTEKEQNKVFNLLFDDVRLFNGYLGKIVWILNPFTITSVGVKLSIGEILGIRGCVGGEVLSYIKGVQYNISDIYFGIKDVSMNCLSVAHLKNANGVKVTVAASSHDDNWLLSPKTDLKILIDQVGKSKRQKLKRTSNIVSLILFALIILSSTLFGHKSSYKRNISKHSTFSSILDLPLPYPEEELNNVWLNPEKRLATRLLSKERDYYLSMSEFMDLRENPYDFWSRLDLDDAFFYGDSQMFYKYALLTGDFPFAYRIAKESILKDFGEREEWAKLLTQTLWQLALESLHELDLVKAEKYNDTYLKLMSYVNKEVYFDAELLPQRILTLSKILQRELKSPRRNSFYMNPGIQNSFGRFSGSSWEYEIPEEDPYDLIQRRKRNLPKDLSFTKDSPFYVVYDSLKTLENLRLHPNDYSDVNYRMLEAYKFAPLECEYQILKNEILYYPTRSTIDKIFAYADKDTYLADDILNVLITEIINSDNYLEEEEYFEKSPRLDRFISAFQGAVPVAELKKRINEFNEQDHDSKNIIERKLKMISPRWDKYEIQAIDFDLKMASSTLEGRWYSTWGKESTIVMEFNMDQKVDFHFETSKVNLECYGEYQLEKVASYFRLKLNLIDANGNQVFFPGILFFKSKDTFIASFNFSADEIDQFPINFEYETIEFNKL